MIDPLVWVRAGTHEGGIQASLYRHNYTTTTTIIIIIIIIIVRVRSIPESSTQMAGMSSHSLNGNVSAQVIVSPLAVVKRLMDIILLSTRDVHSIKGSPSKPFVNTLLAGFFCFQEHVGQLTWPWLNVLSNERHT